MDRGGCDNLAGSDHRRGKCDWRQKSGDKRYSSPCSGSGSSMQSTERYYGRKNDHRISIETVGKLNQKKEKTENKKTVANLVFNRENR